MSIRGGIDDNHLTRRNVNESRSLRGQRARKNAKKRSALRAQRHDPLQSTSIFFPPPEIPADLRRVDRKFVQFLNGQIDVRRAMKVSPQHRPFLPRKRTLKSTVNHECLPTTVRGKSSLNRYFAFLEEAYLLYFHKKNQATNVKLLITIILRELCTRFIINRT